MRVNTPTHPAQPRRIHLAWGLALVCACGGAPTTQAAPTKVEPAKAEAVKPAPGEPAKAAPAAAPLAAVRDDVPLPLAKLLGRPPQEVQAELGQHLTKGMARDTCVRFVPERTFFRCKFALQRYADRTDNFASVQVTYEDGVATGVAYQGWKKGAGPFTPEALLAAVGLTLPEPGKESSPAEGVKLWSWFNNRARLKIGERQYRVEVSARGDDWASSRVEVVLNDPLTPEQKAQVVEAGGADISEPPPGP